MSTDKKRSIASLEASDDASSNGVKIEVADQEYIEANESDGDEEANSSGEDGEVLRAKTSKKQKVEKKADVELMKNDEGDVYVQLSGKRRLTIRKFKDATLIDIREYYTDKSGADKPGSKGISLSVDQWNTLKSCLGDVDAEVQKMEKSGGGGGGEGGAKEKGGRAKRVRK